MTDRQRKVETPVSLDPIDWEHVPLLSAAGAYGLIYRVVHGLVAKVGIIAREEADLQQHLAACGKALPVLGYAEDVSLPLTISRMFCAQHGRRALPKDMITCCCGMPLSVLLMPKADTAIWETFDALTIAEFLEETSSYCYEELGHVWDAEERNLAIYNGHLIALDFGDTEARCY